ncbi:unnamed protein product [Nesidiocoris tenuis]|uniref:Dynein axonemal light chain 1 n=1 Tax=Nesidiocoris tenuis TaxID=355587 RepID=A0A6H5GCS9_9HEMI|nr:unnamed protein product [Nesidiocoris tenuis]CAB0008720.1 unnamed protein product [Nesidiocoris tenuis]
MWEKNMTDAAAAEGGATTEKFIATEAAELDLQFCWPPIEQMDKTLGTLTKCKKLYLSTNNIDKIQGLQGMSNLRVLGLSRNSIKLISGIEAVADTLEELWLSYNHLVSIKGIQVMQKLRVLYLNHNYIRDWAEVSRLGEMPKIADVSFIGNPLVDHCASNEDWRYEVFKRIPHLRRLDGEFRTYG